MNTFLKLLEIFIKIIADWDKIKPRFKELIRFLKTLKFSYTISTHWTDPTLRFLNASLVFLMTLSLILSVAEYWQRIYSPKMEIQLFGAHLEHTIHGVWSAGAAIVAYNYCMKKFIST